MAQSALSGTSFGDLPAEMRIETYLFIFETLRLSRVHVKRITRKTYNKTERFICPSRILAANKQFHHEFSGALEEHAFTTADAIVMDVTDFDFRSAIAFIKSLGPSDRAKLARPHAPKLVVRLALLNVQAFDGDKLGKWLKFSKSSGITVEYEVGEVEELSAVVDYFMGLSGLSTDADFVSMSTVVWDFQEGAKKSKDRGSLLSSLLGMGEGGEDEEESDGQGYEEGEEGSDLDSENMSSDGDFTNEEGEAAEGGEEGEIEW
ncbi:hypothetical protein LTR08_007778 [Meristemomyces frigidus]|nr:hypothetical protein LTR08_007778 [Meristemomyces frigidus]